MVKTYLYFACFGHGIRNNCLGDCQNEYRRSLERKPHATQAGYFTLLRLCPFPYRSILSWLLILRFG